MKGRDENECCDCGLPPGICDCEADVDTITEFDQEERRSDVPRTIQVDHRPRNGKQPNQ